VFIGTGVGEPLELVTALSKRAYELPDTEIVHLLTFGEAPYAHRELAQYFRVNSFFIAEKRARHHPGSLGDYTPVFLSDIPRLFDTGQLPLDVALIQVTPPDEHGMCSFGVSVDIVRSAAENASLVIAQVNSTCPDARGLQHHIHNIDVLVPSEMGFWRCHRRGDGDEPSRLRNTSPPWSRTAPRWSSASPDSAGADDLPEGQEGPRVHTEMVSDSIIDLIESGAITAIADAGPGQIVTSFCLGTKRIYDYVDNNPLFAFHPTEYVNIRSSSGSSTGWWRSTPRWK